jgi:hypothetical protein
MSLNYTTDIELGCPRGQGSRSPLGAKKCDNVRIAVKAYLADNEHNNTMAASYDVSDGGFEASIPARSIVTIFVK